MSLLTAYIVLESQHYAPSPVQCNQIRRLFTQLLNCAEKSRFSVGCTSTATYCLETQTDWTLHGENLTNTTVLSNILMF